MDNYKQYLPERMPNTLILPAINQEDSDQYRAGYHFGYNQAIGQMEAKLDELVEDVRREAIMYMTDENVVAYYKSLTKHHDK